jgi:hypothetical protein
MITRRGLLGGLAFTLASIMGALGLAATPDVADARKKRRRRRKGGYNY